tara:strand:- start:98 stop:370 length:273 start_codon:yes stop_codon:yes gene_type:complete
MKTVKLKDNEIRLLLDGLEALMDATTFLSDQDSKDLRNAQTVLKDVMQSSQVKTLGEAIEANNKEFERTKGARIKEMQKEYEQKSVNWLK